MDKVVRIELEGGYVPTNRYNTTSVTVDTAETSAEMPPNSVLWQDIQTGEGFYDTVQIIHHFPPRTMPHELSPRCASRLPPHHQRAIQYVKAMALSIPSAPAPNRIIHSEEHMGMKRKRAKYPMAAVRGSSVGFCGHYRLTGTVSFYSVFSPYLGVREPALSGSAVPIGPRSFM